MAAYPADWRTRKCVLMTSGNGQDCSTITASYNAMIDAGVLSVDEVFSPIQMILDNELAGALRHLLKPVDVSEEALGFGAIAELGPGGVFAGHPHTGEYFRQVTWEPSVWSRTMLGDWENGGRKTDVDLARERYHQLIDNTAPISELTPEEEQTLLTAIRDSGKRRVAA